MIAGLLSAVWMAWAPAAVAAEPPNETLELTAAARIARVVDADTVIIDRGAAHGITAGADGLVVHPKVVKPGSTQPSVDFNVRSAVGKVARIQADEAEITLRRVARKPKVGDYVGYSLAVPADRGAESLFRLAAFDVSLLSWADEKPLIHFAALRAAKDWRAAEDAVLKALLAEIHANVELARRVKAPIKLGRFQGRSIAEVFAATTLKDITDYVDFVASFPGRYVGHDFKLIETYATWILEGCPGDDDRKLKLRVAPDLDAASAALTKADFPAAEAAYRRVLEVMPQHATAKERLEALSRIRIWRRTLERDPDATGARWELAVKAYKLGAYDLALKHLAKLEAAGYDPVGVANYRSYCYIRLERYDEALKILRARARQAPDDTNLAEWIQYAAARRELAQNPKSARAWLDRAVIAAGDKMYGDAVSYYSKAMDHAAEGDAAFREAARGQQRISTLQELDNLVQWAKEHIGDHRVARARERIDQALGLARDELRDDALRSKLLDDFADEARGVWERDLALELLARRARAFPDDADAWLDLAWTYYFWRMPAKAHLAVDQALRVDPDSGRGLDMKGRLHLEAGELDRAEAFASKANTEHPSYEWSRLLAARIAAARGRWDEAAKWAAEAHALTPDSATMQNALNATARAKAAVAAMAAGKDVARNRLRLVRSLAELSLPREAAREAEALRKKSRTAWREAQLAILMFDDYQSPLAARLEAGRAAKPKLAWEKRELAEVEARLRLAEHPDSADARLAAASAFLAQGQFHQALAALAELDTPPGVALAEKARNGLKADRHKALADQALKRNDYKGALRHARQARGIWWAIGDVQEAGNAAYREINALRALNRIDEARALATEWLDIARKDGVPELIIDFERHLGFMEAATGKLGAVAATLKRAWESCASRDKEACMGLTAKELAEVALDEGRLSDAERWARRSLELARQRGLAEYERMAMATLSDSYLVDYQLTKSEALAKELLERARKALDTEHERFGLMVLGAVAMRRSDAKTALERFSEVYDLGVRTGNVYYRAQARMFSGRTRLNVEKDASGATRDFAQSAELYKEQANELGQAEALFGLGLAHAERGEHAKALAAYAKAAKVADRMERRPMQASLWAARARSEVEAGQVKDAIRSAGKALALAEKLDMDEPRWSAEHVLGRALAADGRGDKALPHLEKAVELATKASRSSGGEAAQTGFLSYGRTGDIYADTIAVLLAQKKVERAMEVLEMSRNAKLRQLFDPGRIKTRDQSLEKSLRKLRSARQERDAAHKQLQDELAKAAGERNPERIKRLSERAAQSDGEVRTLLLRLKRDHRNLYNAIAIKPTSLTRRREDLPPGTAVVQYFMAEDALYSFVVSRDVEEAQAFQVRVASKDIDATVAAYRSAMLGDPTELAVLGRKLYGWLLEPVEGALDKAHTVLIVPFGTLYYLPFQSLVTTKANQPVRYAIEKYRIGYLSSTTIERILEPAPPRAKPSLLAFANPDGTLPGARKELERIQKQGFPDAVVLAEKAATKDQFFKRAGSFRVIHFATHGVLDEDPLASHLKMAEGPLTVEEIAGFAGLEGGSDLVVLSACSTAIEIGKSTGDEVISIAEAFATAGAPTLVASLWDVDDEATMELMATFYRALLDADGDKLDALRRAQLRLMRLSREGRKPFAEPVYWAAFGMVGDFR